jgi:hypothetical protein
MFYQIGPRSASCSINMSELRPSFFVECWMLSIKTNKWAM